MRGLDLAQAVLAMVCTALLVFILGASMLAGWMLASMLHLLTRWRAGRARRRAVPVLRRRELCRGC